MPAGSTIALPGFRDQAASLRPGSPALVPSYSPPIPGAVVFPADPRSVHVGPSIARMPLNHVDLAKNRKKVHSVGQMRGGPTWSYLVFRTGQPRSGLAHQPWPRSPSILAPVGPSISFAPSIPVDPRARGT